MKKLILFSLGLVCLLSSCQAQPSPEKTTEVPLAEITPLKIGDTVPDMVFHHMLNYKDSTARLANFQGRPIILDFFATWCGSCIEALPKLDLLQQKFNGQVQILAVTSQPTDKVSSFLHHNPNMENISLPFITRDSLLNKYFPHKMVPHEVWIDKNKKIIAITRSYYVTATNIYKLLNGKFPKLPIKKDILDFTMDKPLFYDYEENGSKPLYYSIFGRYIKGLPALVLKYRKGSDRIKFFATNVSIINLYQIAIPDLGNRIILNIKDSSRFIRNISAPFVQWETNNCFCYEITVPTNTSKNELHKYMLQDLNRYLGLSICKEKRVVDCWALIQTSNDQFIKTNGGNPMHDLLDRTKPIKTFQNLPISKLISTLNYQIPSYPIAPIIIDETHYTGNIDLKLKVDNIHNIPALRKALQPYGLDLIPVKRKLEMFILTEKKFRKVP